MNQSTPYIYAFLKNADRLPTLPTGIVGSLDIVGVDAIAAVVEYDVPLEAIQQDDQRLVEAVVIHDQVICQVFDQVAVLPLRFGTSFVSCDRLREHLAANQQTYSYQLAQLDGKAEYTLKFIPRPLPAEATPSDTQGKAYFLAKKQRYQAQVDYQQQQQQELQQLAVSIAQTYSKQLQADTQGTTHRLFLLLPQSDAAALYQQCEIWQAQCPTWELTVSQPLPPYHFV